MPDKGGTARPVQMDGTGGGWEALCTCLPDLLRRGQGRLEIDASSLGSPTPGLLARLSTLYQDCTAAGGALCLAQASPDLATATELVLAGPPGENAGRTRSGLIRATCADVATELEQVRTFLSTLSLSDLTTYVLRLVLDEVTTNICLHSGIGEDARMFYRIHVTSRNTIMVFADEGCPFDPTSWNESSGPLTRAPGDSRHPFGIELIRSLSHRAVYRRLGRGLNILRLERGKR